MQAQEADSSLSLAEPLVESQAGLDADSGALPQPAPNPEVGSVTEIFGSDGSRTMQTNFEAGVDLSALTLLKPGESFVVPPTVVERGAGYRIIESVLRVPANNGNVLLRTNRHTVRGELPGEENLPGVRTALLRPPTVVERGDGYKKIESISEYLDADGTHLLKTNRFVEVESEKALEEVQKPKVLDWSTHQRRIQREVVQKGEDDKYHISSQTYFEVGSGIAYQDDAGQWHESVPTFEILPDGGLVARQTSHKVKLKANPNVDDPLEITLPDGTVLKSRALGLGYFDRSSGLSVTIASLQDSSGELNATGTEVIFPNAFNGISATLRYVLSAAGLEQDIILNEQPLPPEAYDQSLNSATCELQVITEFFLEREPAVARANLPTTARTQTGVVMAEPEVGDDLIDFGTMQISRGRAFLLQNPDESIDGRSIGVNKQWQRILGRTILFEAVPYEDLKHLLEALPQPAGQARARPRASRERTLPERRIAAIEPPRRVTVAQHATQKRGVVLDYSLVSSANNVTFNSGETYYIKSPISLTGTTLIQGGTVLKYGPNGKVTLTGNAGTGGSGIAYLVSAMDNSVGAEIFPGAPVGTSATVALQFDHLNSASFSNLEFRNAETAIDEGYSPYSFVLSNCRLFECNTGLRFMSGTVYANLTICNVANIWINSGSGVYSPTGITNHCAFCVGGATNASIARAIPLSIGAGTNASISCAGDENFFKIVVTNTLVLRVTSSGMTDVYGHLLDSNGFELVADDNGGTAPNFKLTQAVGPGIYYVRVHHNSRTGSGPYSLTASTEPSSELLTNVSSFGATRTDSPPWVGFEFKVGNSPITVTELGRWVISGNTGSHVVKLVQGDGTDIPNVTNRVTINTANQGSGFLYAPLPAPIVLEAGTTYAVLSQEQNGDAWFNYLGTAAAISPVALNAQAVWTTGTPPPYNIQSDGQGKIYGPVNLRYFVNNISPVDDHGNTNSTATSLSENGSITGKIDYAGDEDFFRVIVTTNATLTVYTGGTTDTVGYLYSSNMSQVAWNDDYTGHSYPNFWLSAVVNAGTYYIRVKHYLSTATGDYKLYVQSTTDGRGRLVSSVIPGTYIRTNLSAWLGLKFTVGSSPITVRELGRWVLNGNTGSHTVKLLSSDGTTNYGSVLVNTQSQPSGQFLYATLASPVTLLANTAYLLVSQEFNQGDAWHHNYNTETALSAVADSPTSVFVDNTGVYAGGAGLSFVPVDLRYDAAKVGTPVFSVSFNGDHSQATVSATSETGSTVYYTTNGSDPTLASSTSAPVVSSSTPSVKARAFKAGYPPSDVATCPLLTTATVSFNTAPHRAFEYSNGALSLAMSSEANATICYQRGAANWVCIVPPSGSSTITQSIDGVDSGTGWIQAYAYAANKLRSAITALGPLNFRVPQPTSSISFLGTNATLTISTVPSALLDLYMNGSATPTETLSANSSGTATRTFNAASAVKVRSRKPGYVDSGMITANVNQLTTPRIATTNGVLSADILADNAIDVWLLPNFGFDNVYGEKGDFSSWTQPMNYSSDVPNTNYLGSFFSPSSSSHFSVNRASYSHGRTYSMRGFFKGDGSAIVYAGIASYEAGGQAAVESEDVNLYGYGLTYLRADLDPGSSSALVENGNIFSPGTDYLNLFVALNSVGPGLPLPKVNQRNSLSDLYQQIDGTTTPRVLTASTGAVTFISAYNGTKLTNGTIIARRGYGAWHQYALRSGAAPTTWTLNTNEFTTVRAGTEEIALLALLSNQGGVSGFTGLELWEGTQTQRPVLYYRLDGNTNAFGGTAVAGPTKLRISAPTTITLAQRGAQYFDSPIVQRTINFRVAPPQLVPTLNTNGTEVTIIASSAYAGAAIRYTTDLSDPTASSALYTNGTAGKTFPATTTTKWRAFLNGYADSYTATQLGVPTFTPSSGPYSNGQIVVITAPTVSATQLKVFEPRTNVLNLSYWVTNVTGNLGPFIINGMTNENAVEWRRTPHSTLDKVWVGYNKDTESGGDSLDPDGGWVVSAPIDSTKLYRFSVWVRKVDNTPESTSGYTYLGPGWSDVSSLTNSTPIQIPYFWSGLLPLNEWHLIVGFVHPNDGATNSSAKLYNSQGGTVATGTDFRWVPGKTNTFHRAYLYYCTETNIQQEFWNPRLEQVSTVNDPIDILVPPTVPESSPKSIPLADSWPKSILAMSWSGVTNTVASPVVTQTYTPESSGTAPQVILRDNGSTLSPSVGIMLFSFPAFGRTSQIIDDGLLSGGWLKIWADPSANWTQSESFSIVAFTGESLTKSGANLSWNGAQIGTVSGTGTQADPYLISFSAGGGVTPEIATTVLNHIAYNNANPGSSGLRIIKVQARDSTGLESNVAVYQFTLDSSRLPVVNAGPDQAVQFGETVLLKGTVDGLPAAGENITWVQVSGPGSVGFSSGHSTATSSTFPQAGFYVLRISATITTNGVSTTISDDVAVTVYTGAAPLDAGPDQTTYVGSPITLSGLPRSGISVQWSASGPGAVQLSSPSAPISQAAFNSPGVYKVRLAGGGAFDEATVTVLERRLEVDAGPDRTIFPNAVTPLTLRATVVDNLNSFFTYQWSYVSGPVATVSLGTPNAASTTLPNLTVLGTYRFSVQVTDGLGATNTDEVLVHVAADGTRTWTRNADFEEGYAEGITYEEVPDALITASQAQTSELVLLVPNNQGAGIPLLVRLDADSGAIRGTQRAVDGENPGWIDRPVLTSDGAGNVWILQTMTALFNSPNYLPALQKYGKVMGGVRTRKENGIFVVDPDGQYLMGPYKYNTAFDRDGDQAIRTSGSPNAAAAFPWPTPSSGLEGDYLTAATDEALVAFTWLGTEEGPARRTLAVGPDGSIWACGESFRPSSPLVRVNPITLNKTYYPAPTCDSINANVFGVMATSGKLWTAGINTSLPNHLISFETSNSVWSCSTVSDLGFEGSITANPITGDIWYVVQSADHSDRTRVARMSADGTTGATFDLQLQSGSILGIAADRNGDVWVTGKNADQAQVVHLRSDGVIIGRILLPCLFAYPTGLGFDSRGRVWVSGIREEGTQGQGKQCLLRIDPRKGVRTPTGEIVGEQDLFVLLSTFGTGTQSSIIRIAQNDQSQRSTKTGRWTVVHDGGASRTWGKVICTKEATSNIAVQVRSANSVTALPSQAWTPVMPSGALSNSVTGRFAEIQVTFTEGGTRPVLYDLTIVPTGGLEAPAKNNYELAVDDKFNVPKSSPATVLPVLANDRAQNVQIISVSSARHGSVYLENASIKYFPPTDFYGLDRFVYTLTNTGTGLIDRGLVTVSVSPNTAYDTSLSPSLQTIPYAAIGSDTCAPPVLDQNHSPIAVTDNAWMQQNASSLLFNDIPVLANDRDSDGDAFRLLDDFPRKTVFGTVSKVGNVVRYTPGLGAYGTDSFQYTIIDSKGASSRGTVFVRVAPVTPPSVWISSPSDGVLAASSVAINVNVTPGSIDFAKLGKDLFSGIYSGVLFPNGAGTSSGLLNPAIKRVEFLANGKKIGESTAANWGFTWTGIPKGKFAIQAIVTDELGLSGSSDVKVLDVQPPGYANNTAPVAVLDPLGSARLRTGVLTPNGRAYDTAGGNPVRYQFLLYRVDGTLIANVTPAPGTDGMAAGPVGSGGSSPFPSINLSRFENGTYDLVLRAWDGIEEATAIQRFHLNSAFDQGRFRFTEEDATLPTPGLPLRIVRTYDSANVRSTDFGVGWTYELADLGLEIDEDRMMVKDFETDEVFSIRTGGGRNITLTLPGGRRTTFAYNLVDYTFGGFGGLVVKKIVWEPETGVAAGLTTATPAQDGGPGDDMIPTLPGNFYYWWQSGPKTPFENYDMPEFQLSLADGTLFTIRRDDLGMHTVELTPGQFIDVHAYGKARVTEIVSPRKDRLKISAGTIEYFASDNSTAGRKFAFVRNSKGFITEVWDPQALNSQTTDRTRAVPLLRYEYDGDDNLVRVSKLSNRDTAAVQYEVTSYVYGNPSFPHYITDIKDPRGVSLALTDYHNDPAKPANYGKIKSITQPDGRVTEIDYDSAAFVSAGAKTREVQTERLNQGGNQLSQTTAETDDAGNIILMIDAKGNQTERSFDGNRNMTRQTIKGSYSAEGFTRFDTPIYYPNPEPADPKRANRIMTRISGSRVVLSGGSPSTVASAFFNPAGANNALKFTASGSPSATPNGVAIDFVSDNTQVIGNSANVTYDSANRLFTVRYNGLLTTATVLRDQINAAAGALFTVSLDFSAPPGDGINNTGSGAIGETISTREEYNLAGQLRFQVDSRNYVSMGLFNAPAVSFYTENVYDSNGNMTHTWARGSGAPATPLQRNIYFTNPALSGLLNESYDAVGNKTVYTYYTGATADGGFGDVKEVTQLSVTAPSYSGDVWTGTYTKVSSTTYKYDPATGNRTEETRMKKDANGDFTVAYATTKFRYDAKNRLIETTDAEGGVSSTSYNSAGQATATTDRYGATTRYTYDAIGRLVQTIYADGAIARSATDYARYPDTSVTAPRLRQVFQEDRHFAGDPVSGTRTTYDQLGRSMRTERIKNLTIGFNQSGEIASSTPPSSVAPADILSSTETIYDFAGRVDMSRDANGKWTKYDYDEAGRQWRVRQFVNADGSDWIVNSVLNTITTLQDYDKNGNLKWTLDATQFAAISGWPGAATPTGWRNHALNGNSGANASRLTFFTYDNFNRNTRVDLPRGLDASVAFTQSKYDDLGRKWLEIDADNKAKAFAYDSLGRLNWVITDVNPAATALAGGPEFNYYTTAWGSRLADSTVTRYQYDELGNLTAQTDGNNAGSTTFTYDKLGRRLTRTLPGNVRKPDGNAIAAEETWVPDYNSPANGAKINQIRHLDLNGRYVLNRSDLMGRVIERRPDGLQSWSTPLPTGGGVAVTFTYTATGQRASMTDASGTTRYAYDDRDRLRIKQSAPGTIYYDYDPVGNLTEINAQYGYDFASSTEARFDSAHRGATATRSTGAYMRYQYDDRNRLWKTLDAVGASTPVAAYAYTPGGNLSVAGYGNLIATAYDYNARTQLRRVRTVLNPAGTTVGTYIASSTLKANYDYDEAGSGATITTTRSTWGSRLLSNSGRRNQLTETGVTSATLIYDYDNLNRLRKETVGSEYLQYDSGAGYEAGGYDPAGNRRSRSKSSGGTRFPDSLYGTTATIYGVDKNDRLDNDGDPATPSTLFDGNGNTTSRNGVTYGYDFQDRLLSSSAGSTTITYDGDGNRVKKVASSGTTYYLVDDRNPTGYPQVLEEQSVAGASPTVRYVVGLQRISQTRLTGTTGSYYYGYDGLGSVRHLTTKDVSGFPDGSVSDTYNYDAFGVKVPSSTGSTTNNFRFGGEEWDPDLEMYFNRARYYHADLGRFWTSDAYEGNQNDPLSLHKYLYCAADPVNNVDPTGEFTDAISFNSSAAIGIGLVGLSAATVVEAKTHAIGNLMVATGHAGAELLDEASSAAQQAAATAEAAVASQYSSFENALKTARQALRKLGNTLKKVKVVPISQTLMPDVANNVSTAQASGHPMVLTRVTSAQAKTNRRVALAGRGSAGPGKSWDEYPFASGKPPGGRLPQVQAVPIMQNWIQGGIISACYRLEPINVGDSYFVVVIP